MWRWRSAFYILHSSLFIDHPPTRMRTLKIVLAYDGTGFVGWQRQAAGASVQGHLEEALAAIEGQPVTVVGAGRTDAGVHALGQVASCTLAHPIGTGTLARALNAMLPDAVRVLEVDEVPGGFHARFSARAKTYRYLIRNDHVANPFDRRYAWHVPQLLNEASMVEAARLLEGEHDFAALQGAGSAVTSTTRAVNSARVRVSSAVEAFGEAFAGAASVGRIVTFETTGNGFLRHMVRNAVGTLVEIGLGRRQPAWMAEVLESLDRDEAGPTAPAHGLFLVSVAYGPDAATARRTGPGDDSLGTEPRVLAPPDGSL
jgi:tRNA pseudouridine38-40 synthase